MSIQTIYATEFRYEFGSGRTKPCVFGCVDTDGNEVGDIVVKLRGGMDTPELGSFSEYTCSLLARYLNIACAEPFLVDIDAALSTAIPNLAIAERVRKSSGINFATRYLSPAYSEWIPPMKLSAHELYHAANIFAFDAFIQNPDRRMDKVNLLFKNDTLVVIDHELAFSFALDILQKKELWLVQKEAWLRKHVFFTPLHKTTPDWTQLKDRLQEMQKDKIAEQIIHSVPSEWHNYQTEKVLPHIQSVLAHNEEFFQELTYLLL